MTPTEFDDWLKHNDACTDAYEWAESLGFELETIYNTCERGEWLLWWAGRRDIDRKVLVKAAVECAALALPYTDDQRVHDCISVTRAWCEGKATDEVVHIYRMKLPSILEDAKTSPSTAVFAGDAAAAASGVASGWHTQYIYRAVREAAAAATDSSVDPDAAIIKQCADIVRQYITLEMLTRKLPPPQPVRSRFVRWLLALRQRLASVC